MKYDGPSNYDPMYGCNCQRCQYEAGKIKLSPTAQTCWMILILVAFVYVLFWLLK